MKRNKYSKIQFRPYCTTLYGVAHVFASLYVFAHGLTPQDGNQVSSPPPSSPPSSSSSFRGEDVWGEISSALGLSSPNMSPGGRVPVAAAAAAAMAVPVMASVAEHQLDSTHQAPSTPAFLVADLEDAFGMAGGAGWTAGGNGSGPAFDTCAISAATAAAAAAVGNFEERREVHITHDGNDRYLSRCESIEFRRLR